MNSEVMFTDDHRNGKGTYKHNDGSVYTGDWKNDLKHGQGTLKLVNGTIYEGTYENDHYKFNMIQTAPSHKR